MMTANLTFRITPNSEAEKASLWVVDLIEAFDGDERVGYIKLSWIPAENFKVSASSIILFMANTQGHCVIPRESKGKTFDEMTTEELRKVVGLASWSFQNIDYSMGKSKDLLDAMSREQLMERIRDIESHLIVKPAARRLKEFTDFHINRPLVDYIRVTRPRQGIGTQLYIQAAKYLKARGLKLHASEIQTPEAKASWASMTARGWTARSGTRTILVANKIPA